MASNTGARFEIAINGTTRTYRELKDTNQRDLICGQEPEDGDGSPVVAARVSTRLFIRRTYFVTIVPRNETSRPVGEGPNVVSIRTIPREGGEMPSPRGIGAHFCE